MLIFKKEIIRQKMINIAKQIRPLLGGADSAGMVVALNHRNNQ